MGRTGKKGKAKDKQDDEEDFWSDEDLEDHYEEDPVEELDENKLKFTKIKDLELGMDGVHVKAEIDFVGDTMGREYGDEPFALGFLKDDTGEVKMTFWGDDAKKAKKGKKVIVLQASVSEFRGQLQLNPHRKRGIEFL